MGTLFFRSTSDETNVPRESYRRFQQIPTTRHSGKTNVSHLLIRQSLLTTLCIALYLLTASHPTVPDQNVYKVQMTPRIPAIQEQAFDIRSAASVPFQVCPTNPKEPYKIGQERKNTHSLLINKYTKHKLTIIRCQSQRLIWRRSESYNVLLSYNENKN